MNSLDWQTRTISATDLIHAAIHSLHPTAEPEQIRQAIIESVRIALGGQRDAHSLADFMINLSQGTTIEYMTPSEMYCRVLDETPRDWSNAIKEENFMCIVQRRLDAISSQPGMMAEIYRQYAELTRDQPGFPGL